MSGRVFLDTNVLVYLYDSDAPEKQNRARLILERHGLPGAAIISTQVLQEFYVTVTRKLAKKLSEEETLLATRSLSRLPLVQVDAAMIFHAIDLAREIKVSFWDALIIQSALRADCETLFTEDLQHGRRLGACASRIRFCRSDRCSP
jgi:predicted nucleic acid-binding protein